MISVERTSSVEGLKIRIKGKIHNLTLDEARDLFGLLKIHLGEPTTTTYTGGDVWVYNNPATTPLSNWPHGTIIC